MAFFPCSFSFQLLFTKQSSPVFSLCFYPEKKIQAHAQRRGNCLEGPQETRLGFGWPCTDVHKTIGMFYCTKLPHMNKSQISNNPNNCLVNVAFPFPAGIRVNSIPLPPDPPGVLACRDGKKEVWLFKDTFFLKHPLKI